MFQTTLEGEHRPIRYQCRTLNIHDRTFSSPETECLEVVCILADLRSYLMVITLTVYTDPSLLKRLMNVFKPSGQLMRCELLLALLTLTVS